MIKTCISILVIRVHSTIYISFHCNPLGYDGENNEPDINYVVDV